MDTTQYTHFPKKALLALIIPMLMTHQASANDTDTDETTITLDTMVVTLDGQAKEKTGKKIVTRKELNTQNVQDTRDLVRYNAEVDVAEVGRYGTKGFAVRGVDGNRVAMNIDGVALPEVEVNELYSPYGYTYEGRFNPDLEMMGSVHITAGADSLASGSGAVGGSVSYRTKLPKDLLKGDSKLGGYAKTGYTNKNEEWLLSGGLAGKIGNFEGLINYAQRQGHELKNHDMHKHNPNRLNDPFWISLHPQELGCLLAPEYQGRSYCGFHSSALYPDSSHYKSRAIMAKAHYDLNDQHRLGIHGMYQTKNTTTNAISKITSSNRIALDSEDMKNYGISYRYFPENNHFLNQLDANYTHQDISGLAFTDLRSGWLDRDTGQSRSWYGDAEYRPTRTKTDQLKIDVSLNPLETDKFGSHQFKLGANLAKQDYTSNKITISRKSSGEYQYAFQPNIIPFPDAKKDNFNLTLSDEIFFNDRLTADLGVRYDYIRYMPYFEDTIYFDDPQSSEMYEINKNLKTSKIGFYNDYRNGVYNQKPTFDKLTYSGLFEYQVMPETLTARYKVGTGFLAPSVTQMYSSFQGQGVQQLINTKLKPESSLNNEIEFEFSANPMTLTLGAYQSDYKNFIHSKWWADVGNLGTDCRASTCIQSINLDSAQVRGFKAGMRADLSRWAGHNKLYLTADYHTSKDEATYEADQEIDGKLTINTLASVPTTTIYGLDYHLPDDKATFHIKARHIKAKKADDTKLVEIVRDSSRPAGYREQVGTYKFIHHSNDALVLDMFGSYKFKKGITLNAGVYNLTNQKYIPWDSLRQFAITNVNSMVDRWGYGLNRYTAPGRNYAVALTYEF